MRSELTKTNTRATGEFRQRTVTFFRRGKQLRVFEGKRESTFREG